MTFFISAQNLEFVPRELNPTIEVGDPHTEAAIPDPVPVRIDAIHLADEPAGRGVIVDPIIDLTDDDNDIRAALNTYGRRVGEGDRYALTVAVDADDYCAIYGPWGQPGGNHEDLLMEIALDVDAEEAPVPIDAHTEIIGVFRSSVLGRGGVGMMLVVNIVADFDGLDEYGKEVS